MTQLAAELFPVRLEDGPFAVSTSGLEKRYGPVTALAGVDLQVPEHGVYVLVGPNGAGKSTLIRTLMGLARRASGDIDVLGSDPALVGDTVRGRVGYVPEDHRVGYPWMKVGRLIQHHAAYRPSWDPDYVRRLAEIYEIDPGKRCHALSKGQSRRVQILLALAHRPPLLLLDEPTDGLDHTIRDETLGILSEHLSDAPTTVLISTHRVYEVESLVDHVGVLSGGRILGQFPRADLHRLLLRYWVDVPDGWTPPRDPGGHVIRRKGGAREVEWTVWGEPDEVTRRLAASGATVREVTGLSVDDAAVALLSRKEAS